MVREFSEEKRQEIFRALDEIDNREWKSFMEWCGSSAEEFGDWPDKLAVSAYTRYVDEYHKKVLEINEMTRNRVNTVFENVAEIDTRYAGRMRECREKIKEQVAMVRTMTEFMESMSNGNPNMALLNKGSVNESIRTEEGDDEGNTEIPVVNWEDIRERFEVRGPRVLAQCLRDHGITDQDEIDRVLEWIKINNIELLEYFNTADIYDGYDDYNKEETYNTIMENYIGCAREYFLEYAADSEYDGYYDWGKVVYIIQKFRPGLLKDLNEIQDNDKKAEIFESIIKIYNEYRIDQGAIILENFIEGNKGNSDIFNNVQEIGLIISLFRVYDPNKLIYLYEIKDSSAQKAYCESLIEETYIKIYNKYRIEQGAIILENFIEGNSENLEDGQKPELIVPLFRFFDSKRLIYLYGIKDASAQKAYCEWLIGISENFTYNQKFYAYTWLQINSIESFTNNNVDYLDFSDEVDEFVRIYRDHEELYTRIAEETGVPPIEVAVIHYRENSIDFLNEKFNMDLLNGKEFDRNVSQDDFFDSAKAALQSQQWKINASNLTFETTDIVSMVCFAERYNGTGYYDNNLICPYSYSGTDVYVSGKFIKDGVYDPNAVDKQIGTYRLLLAAEAGIYDAEDGKNYVNEMCGGYTQ